MCTKNLCYTRALINITNKLSNNKDYDELFEIARKLDDELFEEEAWERFCNNES